MRTLAWCRANRVCAELHKARLSSCPHFCQQFDSVKRTVMGTPNKEPQRYSTYMYVYTGNIPARVLVLCYPQYALGVPCLGSPLKPFYSESLCSQEVRSASHTTLQVSQLLKAWVPLRAPLPGSLDSLSQTG